MEKVEDYRNPEVLRRMYWDEGLTPTEIGERLFVSEATVRNWMVKLNIPRHVAGPRFRGRINYRDRATMESLIKQGFSNRQTANKAGVHVGTIEKWKGRLGLAVSNNCQPARRYDVGGGRMLTVLEIARECGLSKSTVAERLKRGWTLADTMSTPPLSSGSKPAPKRREA